MRIARDERANRPGERCDITSAHQCLERVRATAGQLDERTQRIISLKANGRPCAGRGKVVRAKERVGTRQSDAARERLFERDNGEGAREEPEGDDGRGETHRGDEDRDRGGSHLSGVDWLRHGAHVSALQGILWE